MRLREAARLACAACIVCSVLGSASGARGHARSLSTSSWDLEPGASPAAQVVARVQWSDLQRALPALAGLPPSVLAVRADLTRQVDAYLQRGIGLRAGPERCAAVGPATAVPSVDPGQLARRWRVRCAGRGALELHVDAFFEVLPGHVHLARARLPDGTVLERVFALDQRSLALSVASGPTGEASGSGFADYVGLGIQHIATGYDHLVFLLALLLVGVSFREVATVVTGFTLAHSVTLALGVLGVVTPLPAAVEALIGLSIAVVALENFALTVEERTRRGISWVLGLVLALFAVGAALGRVAVPALALAGVAIFSLCYLGLLHRVERPARLRWFVAFVFGLVHGFGFAGVLVEVGLPPDRLAPALLGFNVGVEVGQLTIVAAVWPLLRLALRGPELRRTRLVQLGSTPALVAGLFWFVTRALG